MFFFFLFFPHLRKHFSLWHGPPGRVMKELSRPHALGSFVTLGAEYAVFEDFFLIGL